MSDQKQDKWSYLYVMIGGVVLGSVCTLLIEDAFRTYEKQQRFKEDRLAVHKLHADYKRREELKKANEEWELPRELPSLDRASEPQILIPALSLVKARVVSEGGGTNGDNNPVMAEIDGFPGFRVLGYADPLAEKLIFGTISVNQEAQDVEAFAVDAETYAIINPFVYAPQTSTDKTSGPKTALSKGAELTLLFLHEVKGIPPRHLPIRRLDTQQPSMPGVSASDDN